jgi:hypothetical protein
MSNQRPGKMKPAAMRDDGTGMRQLIGFMSEAADALNRYGNEDAAFYFEQVEEWLRSGKTLNSKPAAHILGL